ncbi:marC integral membrane family protein, partial [Chlamydia psittaci 06-1683]
LVSSQRSWVPNYSCPDYNLPSYKRDIYANSD